MRECFWKKMQKKEKQMLMYEQRENLKKLSVPHGGATTHERKATPTSTPTIVIGLGGLGCQTVNMLKGKFHREYGEREHIYFRILDVDQRELHTCCKDTWHDGINDSIIANMKQDEVISLFEPEIAHLLMPHVIPPNIKRWLNPELIGTPIDNTGARQNRQIGRAVLTNDIVYSHVYDKLRYVIHRAIEDYHFAGTTDAIDIILVAGIGGGTGSGIMIDLTYMIHDIFFTFACDTYRITGYVYAPDVQFYDMPINCMPAIQDCLKRNGYAALKEIDYFMNLRESGGKYRLRLMTREIFSEKNLFDFCAIVPSTERDGMPRSKKQTVFNLTEHLIDYLCERNASYGSYYNWASLTPLLPWRMNWFAAAGADKKRFPRTANYCYLLLEHVSANFPMEEIFAYCTNGMFQNMYQMMKDTEQEEKRAAVKYIIESASIDSTNRILEEIYSISGKRKVSIPRDMWPSKREARSRMDEMLHVALGMAEMEYVRISQIVETKLQSQILDIIHKKLEDVFAQKGPYFVAEVMKDIFEFLRILCMQVREKECRSHGVLCEPQVRDELEHMAYEAGRIVAGTIAMQAYMDCVWQVAEREMQYILWRTVYESIIRIQHELEETYQSIYLPCAEMLDVISETLHENVMYATSGKAHIGAKNIINLYDPGWKTQNLKGFLDDVIRQVPASELYHMFFESMRGNQEAWQQDACGEIQAIFDYCLNTVLSYDALEKVIVAAYSLQPLSVAQLNNMWVTNQNQRDAILTNAAIDIMSTMSMLSTMSSGFSKEYDSAQFGEEKIITLVNNAPNLSRIIRVNLPMTITELSRDYGNKYTFLHKAYCVPLYALNRMEEYAWAYRNGYCAGTHLNENEENWQTFPEPMCLDILAGKEVDYSEFSDYRMLLDIKADVDEAINELGLITLEGEFDEAYRLYRIDEKPEDMETFRRYVHYVLGNNPSLSFRGVIQGYESGYWMTPIPIIRPNSDLNPLDLDGTGSNVEIGDLYKIIRMSVYYMDLLKDNLELMREAKAVYDEVICEIERAKKYSETMCTFVLALQAGLIRQEGKHLMSYTTREREEILVNLRSKNRFDKQFILYHAFVQFYNLHPDVIGEIRIASEIFVDEQGEVPEVSIIRANVEEVIGEKILGAFFAKKDINEEAKESEMDYTLVDNGEKDIHGVLSRFYSLLYQKMHAM